MKPILTVAKFAALPAILVAYVAVMGSTGTCPTCAAMVDWAVGRSAEAGVPAEVSSAAETADEARSDAPDGASVPAAESGPLHRLALPAVGGGSIDLARFAGKPMLIEVWATWCAPCVRVRAMLTEAAPTLSEKATLLAVSVDQGGAAAVSRHLAGRDTVFVELLSTPEFLAALRPHNPGNTIPKLVYVDGAGHVAGIELGASDPKWVAARLEALR